MYTVEKNVEQKKLVPLCVFAIKWIHCNNRAAHWHTVNRSNAIYLAHVWKQSVYGGFYWIHDWSKLFSCFPRLLDRKAACIMTTCSQLDTCHEARRFSVHEYRTTAYTFRAWTNIDQLRFIFMMLTSCCRSAGGQTRKNIFSCAFFVFTLVSIVCTEWKQMWR